MSIHQFLLAETDNPKGLSIASFWAFTDDELENTHDFFQWAFPLDEPSNAVPSSPVLTKAEVKEISGDPEVGIIMVKAASRYRDYLRRKKHWVCSHNHNHLRITRVIKSLRLLVGDGAADKFKSNVLSLAGDELDQISETSRGFWERA